jgi:hypothetical protein
MSSSKFRVNELPGEIDCCQVLFRSNFALLYFRLCCGAFAVEGNDEFKRFIIRDSDYPVLLFQFFLEELRATFELFFHHDL